MLSRIAESLYWLGRFVERADDTARLLDVQYHLLLEDPGIDEGAACRALLDVMGATESDIAGDLSPQAVARLLADDAYFAGSIRASLAAAWENARGARETISAQMWEVLNATRQQLPLRASEATSMRPHGFFDWVRERTTLFAGLADSTMSRDESWQFMVLGRALERADMTTRMLAARSAEVRSGWNTTLRCCSAYEAYLRTYRRTVEPSLAIEFLVLDRLFPRSIFHSLTDAEQSLAEIDPRAGRVGVDDDARRLLGRVCAELEFLTIEELLSDLPAHLTRVQVTCNAVHEAVADRYFRETTAIEWETESVLVLEGGDHA
ncbi:MAG: alpha-E domain-containing protein [Acidimicrobiia bacterium]